MGATINNKQEERERANQIPELMRFSVLSLSLSLSGHELRTDGRTDGANGISMSFARGDSKEIPFPPTTEEEERECINMHSFGPGQTRSNELPRISPTKTRERENSMQSSSFSLRGGMTIYHVPAGRREGEERERRERAEINGNRGVKTF